jgi:hypothetical protein
MKLIGFLAVLLALAVVAVAADPLPGSDDHNLMNRHQTNLHLDPSKNVNRQRIPSHDPFYDPDSPLSDLPY